jgi:hypothetical protein
MRVRLDRLRERFGWTGGKYRALMAGIVSKTHATVQERVATLSEEHFRGQLRRMKKSTARQLQIPKAIEVQLSRQQQIRKGATNGALLADTMRTKLSQALRTTMAEYIASDHEHSRGQARGTVNPALVDQFQGRISELFSEYTQSGNGEFPPNIRTIAETEVRSAASDTKHQYAVSLAEANRGKIFMTKTWIHRPGLSAEPREGHAMEDGRTIGLHDRFMVANMVKRHGTWWHQGDVAMLHPHDPSAPPEQVINCHCEVNYRYEFVTDRMAGAVHKAFKEDEHPRDSDGRFTDSGIPSDDRLLATGGSMAEFSKLADEWIDPRVQKGYHKLAGRTEFQGLPISLEHHKGGVRQGVDPDGKPWKTKMLFPYGYIRGTRGTDGDEVDVFIGDFPESPNAYVIHTYKPGSMDYDEDKVMLGFAGPGEARRWFEAHYDRMVLQSMEEIPMDEFKRIIADRPGQRIEVLKALKAALRNHVLNRKGIVLTVKKGAPGGRQA